MQANPRTLAGAVDQLPPEVYANPAWKGLAWMARDLLLYGLCVAGLLATDRWYLVLPLWIAAALSITALFILGHDAAHGSLFKSARLNSWVGHLCMLPALHVYAAWCYGHNRIHHGHTLREMDTVWHPVSPAQYRDMSWGDRAAHRLKWSWAGAGIYYIWDVWWTSLLAFTGPRRTAGAVRRDRLLVAAYAAVVSLALLAVGATTSGTVVGALWLWLKVFLVPFLLWNWLMGFAVYLQHIAEDIPWSEGREWDGFTANMEGAEILHMPGWLNFFTHNIFLHVPHHVDRRIPFYHLPAASDALLAAYPGVACERTWNLGSYLRTTRRCKLFDFSTGTWHGYDAA
jgi:acyl-lipid omega-6 desaturase (Delta-12 desaturase)